MKIKSLLSAVMLTLSANYAMANPDVLAWRESTNAAFLSCRSKMYLAIFLAETKKTSNDLGAIFQPTHDCVNGALADGKKLTQALLSQKFNQGTQALIKDYYASWATALEALPGLQSRTEEDARSVTTVMQGSLNKTWRLIGLDLGL